MFRLTLRVRLCFRQSSRSNHVTRKKKKRKTRKATKPQVQKKKKEAKRSPGRRETHYCL